MGHFLEAEKLRQTAFKIASPNFSAAARADGIYRDRPRPFCLPRECAEENLHPRIRAAALHYFERHAITWHQGEFGKPSNHLCSSQACCVNFLMPFAREPAALARLLKPVYPALDHMLPLEDGLFVAFEWIGAANYLGEKVGRNGQRTRGANFTSADAAVKFIRADGRRHIALIEWKYTEAYGGEPLRVAASGTDRMAIYRHLYERDDCPLDKSLLPGFDALFYEPFYQLMRQQFLAHEMERAHELGADSVSLLHIAPAANLDFQRVTSPALRPLGDTATGVWRRLVRDPERFSSVNTEAMFGHFPAGEFPSLSEWSRYIRRRYGSQFASEEADSAERNGSSHDYDPACP